MVQDYLRSYRTIRGINKESAKEDLAQIFANARRAGDDAVKELVQEIRVQRHKEVLQSLAAPKPKPDPLAAAPPSAPTTAAPSAPAALAPSVSVIRDNNSRAHVPDLPQDSPPVDDSLAVLPELLSNLPPTEPLPNEAATLPVLPAPENVDQTKV